MTITALFIFLSDEKAELSAVFLYEAQDTGLKLTTLNFQSAVLFVQRVSPQIHHAGCCCRDSESQRDRKKNRHTLLCFKYSTGTAVAVDEDI